MAWLGPDRLAVVRDGSGPSSISRALPGLGRLRLATRALLLGALLGLLSVPSSAELVVFSNGRVLRTESFEIVGERARMELESQGVVWVSMELIERVVDNEVELTPEERQRAMAFGGVEERTDSAANRFSAEASPGGTLPNEIDPAELDPARSISGKVLNELGEPVEGIEVRARAIRLFQENATAAGGVQVNVESRSGADGAFQFAHLADGEYSVRTLATDRYTSAQMVVRTGVDFANLVVSEERPLEIFGLVTSAGGEPLNGVRVTPVGKPAGAAVTDSRGYYELEIPVSSQARLQTLRFERDEYRETALSLTAAQILGQSEVQLDASLEPLASFAPVGGLVTNREGTPVAGERVHLLGEQRYESVTDETGGFSMPEVETGQVYRLWISPRGPYRAYREQVRVAEDGLDVKVILESEPLEHGSLAGRMLNASGNPVPNFSLWLQSSNPSGWQPRLVTSDASGAFAIDEIPAGRLSFTTQSNPQFTVTGLDLAAGEAKNADLILDRGPHQLRGQVVDDYGNPVPASQVTLQWFYRGSGLQSQSLRRSASDANGLFAFSEVGSGAHLVSVTAPGFHKTSIEGQAPGDLVLRLRAVQQEGASEGR